MRRIDQVEVETEAEGKVEVEVQSFIPFTST